MVNREAMTAVRENSRFVALSQTVQGGVSRAFIFSVTRKVRLFLSYSNPFSYTLIRSLQIWGTQELMDGLNNRCPFTNASGNTLDRSGADITHSENAGFASGVSGQHFLATNSGARHNKSFFVKLQASTKPVSVWLGPCHHK
jgi:hypothetical protein